MSNENDKEENTADICDIIMKQILSGADMPLLDGVFQEFGRGKTYLDVTGLCENLRRLQLNTFDESKADCIDGIIRYLQFCAKA